MKTWEPIKARIYELYIGQGLSLVQVREVLAREEGFEACTRSYRAQISKWGWLKNNHQHLLHTGGHGVGATTPTARSGSTTPIKQEHQHQQMLSGMPHIQLSHHTLPHFGAPRQQQHDAYGMAALSGRLDEHDQGSTADEAEDYDGSRAAALMECKNMNDFYMQQHQHQQRQQYHHQSGYNSHHHQQLHHRSSMSGLHQRRESVNMVILDNHGLNKRGGSFSGSVTDSNSNGKVHNNIHGNGMQQQGHLASSTISEDSEEEDKSGNTNHTSGDSVDSEAEEEERRRYHKRQRHRSIIDVDGVHEIRFDDSGASSHSTSTSASSSPKSSGGAGADDDAGENIVMIDAGVMGVDDDVDLNRRNMEVEMERDGDTAQALEEITNIYPAGIRSATGMKTFGKHGSFGRSQGEKYLHVLNHKSPAPSPCPPHSPRLGARSMISRVSTPFQRMSSPFIRAAGTGNQISGYLEVVETIPQMGAPTNMNAFSKITDWLLILTNGISRKLPLMISHNTSGGECVKHLTILYHANQTPGADLTTALAASGNGSSGSIHLGTIPTVHAQDPTGRCPLHIAIRHRLPLEIVKMLIDLGGSVSAKDDQEINCLHEALQLTPPVPYSAGGRAEWTRSYLLPLIEMLLNATAPQTQGRPHPLINEPMAWSSDSPLHIALKNSQDISVIRLLIKTGAEVGGVLDVFEASPLHIACQHLSTPGSSAAAGGDMPHKTAIIELLMQHGADEDVNTKTADNHTPLHYAVKALCAPMPAISAATSSHIPAFGAACYKDNYQVVEMLVTKGGADVSIRNGDGYAAQEMASLALASRIESASTGEGAVQYLSRAVRMLVKAEREAYLKKEEAKTPLRSSC